MGDPEDGDGPEPGIGDHDLFPALGGGIALIQGFHVQKQEPFDLRQALREAGADPVGGVPGRVLVQVLEAHRRHQLVTQAVQSPAQQRLIRHVRIFPPESHGEQQRLELMDHFHDLLPVRGRTGMRAAVNLLRRYLFQGLHRFSDLFFHAASSGNPILNSDGKIFTTDYYTCISIQSATKKSGDGSERSVPPLTPAGILFFSLF